MSRKGTIVTVSAVAVAATAALIWFRLGRRRMAASSSNSNNDNNNKMSPQLLENFQQAAKTARSLDNLQSGDKLLLYGLYKQATVGNVLTENEPSTWNVVAHAKYEAHLKFQDMSQSTAMEMYVAVIHEFQTLGNKSMEYETEPLDMWNAMGVRPSMPCTYADEDEDDDVDETDDQQHQDSIDTEQSSSQLQSQDSKTKTKTATSSSLLQKAVRMGKEEQVKELLSQHNVVENNKNIDNNNIVNQADQHGQTALHFAADRGNVTIVQLLLKDGKANPNAADCEGISVLQASVIAGHANVARLLLEYGANPYQADMDGDTPLSCVQDDGSKEMQAVFQPYLSIVDKNGNPQLKKVAEEGEEEEEATAASTTPSET